ncbi:MAG: DJ-1/PfpI family protein [Gammaproteobacteria bacterium]|nr:DJ-1/PfpI family protein [Gammaproteobacteria bacterium]
MRILVLVANGSEDSELVNTISLLKRAGIDNYLLSVDDSLNLTLSHSLKIVADEMLKNKKVSQLLDFDAIFLPGGKRGTDTFKKSEKVLDLLRAYSDRSKPIFAICAAPSVLGKAGIMDGINFTCYDSFEKEVPNGIYHKEVGAIKDKNFITAKSAAYSFDLAYLIINYLKGEEEVLKVKKSILL